MKTPLPAALLLLSPLAAAAAPQHAVPSLEAESATFAPGRGPAAEFISGDADY